MFGQFDPSSDAARPSRKGTQIPLFRDLLRLLQRVRRLPAALQDARAEPSWPLRAYVILARILKDVRVHNLNVLAAGIGLYAFLALLPFIASVAVIYGMFVEPDAVEAGVRSLLFMAPSRAQDLVADRLVRIMGRWNGGLPTIAAGLLLALYAAARAARSILAALNLIHGNEPRGFLKRWGVSLNICLAGGMVTLLALILIAASGYVGELMPGGALVWLLSQAAFWLILAAALSVLLSLLYRYAPNGPTGSWREVAPGAVAASLLWLLGSLAFSAYVPVFARYDVTYGSLAAVVVLQLWLYASAFVLLLGAQLNMEIRRSAERQVER